MRRVAMVALGASVLVLGLVSIRYALDRPSAERERAGPSTSPGSLSSQPPLATESATVRAATGGRSCSAT